MEAVLVGIGEDDDLVVVGFVEVEVVPHSRAERRDERSYFLVGEHLIEPLLFDVERLSAKGKNRLELPHARLLCRAACGIALDDEELVLLGFPARASGKFSHEHQRVDAVLGARRVLGLPRGKTDAGRPLRLLDDLLEHLLAAVLRGERAHPLDHGCLHDGPHLGIAEFCLGLPFKLHVLELDGKDGRQPFAEVIPLEVGVLLLQELVFARIVVEHPREAASKARLVRAAFGRGDVVDEGKEIFRDLPRVLDGELHPNAVRLRLVVERLVVEGGFPLVERLHEVGDAAVVLIFHMIGLRRVGEVDLLGLVALLHLRHRHALIGEGDRDALVEKGELAQPILHDGELEGGIGKDILIGQKVHERTVLFGALLGLFEGGDGNARLPFLLFCVVIGMEFHAPDVSVAAHFDLQPLGKGIGDRRTHAVQAAREGIIVLVELAARMQLGKDDLYARDLGLGVDVGGNAAPVVLYGRAAVLIDAHVDPVAIPVRRLVDGVVHDLPEDVVQSAHARGTDIHAGAQAHRVQPLQNGDIARIVMLLCHSRPFKMQNSFPYYTIFCGMRQVFCAIFSVFRHISHGNAHIFIPDSPETARARNAFRRAPRRAA